MTRIMFWNIENFGINKVFSSLITPSPGHGGLTHAQTSASRRQLIDVICGACNPDIVVIIEVSSGDNSPNELATQTGGMEAVAQFQYLLNGSGLYPGGWGLVPPLYTGVGGVAETVGILYRRQNAAGTVLRFFTGPNIWTAGGYAGTSEDPATGLAPAAYPTPTAPGMVNINSMLCPPPYGGPRQIPAASQYNAGLNENVVAARVAFDDGTGNNTYVNFNGLREPLMASFVETGAGPGFPLIRNLTIFGVHSPPATGAAYMALLATVPDIGGAIGMNETKVIGGDFNVNLLAANGTSANAYAPLTGAGYSTLVSPTAVGVPASPDQYRGYFATHIKDSSVTAASRFLWSDPNTNTSDYPGYGYIGSTIVGNFFSIDNILVQPLGGHNYQTTIMNPVVGTPMGAVAMPADNPPIGTVALASQFGAPPMGWPGAPAAANYPGIGGANALVAWANYQRIKNTSDHFAIFADV